MRQTSDADAEAWVLTTEPGRALLDEVAATSTYGPADLQRWRRHASPERVGAAVRLAVGRTRGKAKFTRAEEMWFEPVGLEQATAETVARHKALRFRGSHLLDLCCGIGGDTLALASEAQVVAVDADQGMCRRTRWNAQVYDVAARVDVIRAQAERIAYPSQWLVHIDPDRRQGVTKRARELLGYSPGLEFLQALPGRVRGGAIKLGPASDFVNHFGEQNYELELTSLGGECKEATVWFGALASCRRRATRLPENVSWTDQDGPRNPVVPIASPLALAWVYDPDPALGRSGLLDSFAAANGLARCAPGIDFLTSPEPIDSPFLACFEVLEILPLDLKTIGKLVTARKLGPLEIKTKGTDLRPEALRAQWKPRGPHPATLLLMGGKGTSRAILARRRSPVVSQP